MPDYDTKDKDGKQIELRCDVTFHPFSEFKERMPKEKDFDAIILIETPNEEFTTSLAFRGLGYKEIMLDSPLDSFQFGELNESNCKQWALVSILIHETNNA